MWELSFAPLPGQRLVPARPCPATHHYDHRGLADRDAHREFRRCAEGASHRQLRAGWSCLVEPLHGSEFQHLRGGLSRLVKRASTRSPSMRSWPPTAGRARKIFASPQDWTGYNNFDFWFFGTNSGAPLRLEILDDRASGSTTDTSERFAYLFSDNFSGWRHFILPWSSFLAGPTGSPPELPTTASAATRSGASTSRSSMAPTASKSTRSAWQARKSRSPK